MGSPVVHFEVRSGDPDAARSFYGEMFGWSFAPAGMPGYTYVDTGAEGSPPGGIGPTQAGTTLATFYVGVQNVDAALQNAVRLGGKIVQPATTVPGVTFGLFADPEGNVVGVASG